MSYVKDLMAVAAEWVKLNSTASGMLKIPRTQKKRQDRSYLDRYERKLAATRDPAQVEDLRRQLQRLCALHDTMDVEEEKIRKIENFVEDQVNQIDTTGQTKYTLPAGVHEGTALYGRWCLAWAHAGYNVFDLGNDFVAAMLLTDPRAIDFELLRAPFPGILVTIPAGFVAGVEGLPYTKLHLYYVDGSWGLYATDGVHVLDTHVAEGQTLSWEIFEGLKGGAIEDVDDAAIRSIRQIAFGMLAYVTAVERAIEERPAPTPKKRAKDEDRLRPRVYDVGRVVKIDPILVKYARAGAREIALQLKHRFIVRGHYRNQPHGPGRRDRKSIWIEPFFKGPEEGAKIVHTYKPMTTSADGAGKQPVRPTDTSEQGEFRDDG